MVTLIDPGAQAPTEPPLVTLGVLADSHIPDRRRSLQPEILACFRDAGVQAIFHAGDICAPRVLTELNKIAPVTAVRGNRDWAFRRNLPAVTSVHLGGLEIGIAHGHGSLAHYLIDKGQYMLVGYRFQRYYQYLIHALPTAELILFGHTHTPEVRLVDGRLLFNPGSSCCKDQQGNGPCVGLLRIYPQKQVQAEFIALPL